MTTERRWLDEGASPEVARLLESVVIDEPSVEQLQSLRARVAPLLNAPPGSLPGASGAVGAAGKVLTAVALLALGAGLSQWFSGPNEVPPLPPPAVAAPEPEPVAVIAVPAPPPPPPTRPRALPAPVAAPVTPPVNTADEELELLQAAMSAATPNDALTLVEQHVARFPSSSLTQEREVLAVQALSKLGRTADARARADAFKERWPTSTHLLRLEALIAPP